MSAKFLRDPIAALQAVGKTTLGSMVTTGWSLVCYLEVDSGSSTTEAQTIFSSGGLVSGAFNLCYGGPAHSDPNTIHCTVGSSTNRYKAPNGSFPQGWKGYFMAQRAPSGNLSFFWCPVLVSAPADAASVQSAANLLSTTSQLTQLTRTQVSIGARGDSLRGLDQTIGRVALVQGIISPTELARLAYGEEVTDIGKTPLVYVRLNDAADTADRGSDANEMTLTGALADGAAPGWGYTGPVAPSAPAFTAAPAIIGEPAVGGAVTFQSGTATGSPAPVLTQQWTLDGADIPGATGASYTPLVSDGGKTLRVRQTATSSQGTASSTSQGAAVAAQQSGGNNTVAEVLHKVIQRTIGGTSAPVAVNGTYDLAPTSIEVRLYAADGTTVAQDWTAVTGATIANNVWAGTVVANQGGPYRHAVRFKDGSGTVIGSTPPATNTWNVGALFAVGGSSTGEGWFTTGTFTARDDVYKFRFNAWSGMGGTSNGPMCLFANSMAQKLGVPIGMIAYAVSGTTLEEWSRGNTAWTSFASAVTARGGKLEGVLFTAGSNDANESGADSYDTHLLRCRRLVGMIRDLVAQPNLPIVWTGFNRRPSANQVQSDYVREVENTLGDDANICAVQTVDLELGGDNAHLTGNGYRDTILRVNYQWVVVNGVANRRGPKITGFEFSGAQIVATLLHRAGTDFTPASGASGFTVSDADGPRTVVAVDRLDATHLRITCDQALVAPVVTKHLAGAAPVVTAPVLDNAQVPLPLTVQTMLATTQASGTPDTTAPAMTGTIVISNITTSGAKLAWQAAADAVGIAGYEYSTNGGTSYANVGNALTVTLSGLGAGATFAVRVRAYDAAGNRSAPLSASFTTLAEQPPVQDQVDGSKIAAGRKVVFPGGTRVVVFGAGPGITMPNAPYLREGRWTADKHPLDQRYYVADVTADLRERNTTAKSVTAIVAGVAVLEQPVIQGNLIPVKLGGFNAAPDASNFCTFRITCANGERFDRTLWFRPQEGRWTLSKDPDDESFYVGDIGHDLADSVTTATAVTALPVGVALLAPVVVQGNLVVVKLGGMDGSPDPVNYCDLRVDCANGERFYRTIHFNRVDN